MGQGTPKTTNPITTGIMTTTMIGDVEGVAGTEVTATGREMADAVITMITTTITMAEETRVAGMGAVTGTVATGQVMETQAAETVVMEITTMTTTTMTGETVVAGMGAVAMGMIMTTMMMISI